MCPLSVTLVFCHYLINKQEQQQQQQKAHHFLEL